jgi:hypothetical protein
MKVELKEIINQLSEAIQLEDGTKVSAIIDGYSIVGWTIVTVFDDGTIKPINDKVYKNLKELLYAKMQ